MAIKVGENQEIIKSTDESAVIKVDGTVWSDAVDASDVSLEDIKKVRKFEKDYATTSLNNVAKDSAAIFKDNKKVQELEYKYPFGSQAKLDFKVHQNKSFRKPGTDETVERPHVVAKVEHGTLGKTALKNAALEIADNI